MRTVSFLQRRQSDQRGLSLLESVVYVALIALVLVSSINIMLISVRAFAVGRAEHALATEGRAAMDRIIYEVRLASATETASSVLGTSPGTLALTTIVSPDDETAITRTITMTSAAVMIAEGASSAVPLTAGVVPQALTFYRTAAGSSEAVRVVLRLSAGTGVAAKTATFYGMAVLRGSY